MTHAMHRVSAKPTTATYTHDVNVLTAEPKRQQYNNSTSTYHHRHQQCREYGDTYIFFFFDFFLHLLL